MLKSRDKIRNRNRFAAVLALESLESRKLLSTTTVELPNGTVDVSTFDQAGHLTAFTSTDPAGVLQLSATDHYNAAGAQTSQEFDFGPSFGRLAGASQIETFNATTGHMTSFTETFADGSMDTCTYNSAGMQTSSAAFDANGNFASQQIYTYSPTGSLATVTDTHADGSSVKTSWYADEIVQSIVTTAPDGTTTTQNYKDVTSGTWNDMIA